MNMSVEEYLYDNYSFQFNEVNSRLYWKEENHNEFRLMKDSDFNTLLRYLKNEGLRCSKTELVQLLTSDFTPKFNPFEKYFDGLIQWDGQIDYIEQLSDTLSTTNQPLWRKCFKKWIVAKVGCLLKDDVVNQTAPILCGGQGIGKTTWVGKLVPEELKNYFFSGSVVTSSKDSIIQLSECMLIDMDELESFGHKSIEGLKSQMSKSQIYVRRPYGRFPETLPRRASFIGSINRKEFLKDETGSRRFLCFEVLNIDYEHKIKMSDVYSQAISLLKNNFNFWFNLEEIQEIHNNNQQFQESTLEMELIMQFFEPISADNATLFMSSTDIAGFLKQKSGLPINNSTVQHIGKALSTKKFVNVTRKDRKVWALSFKQMNAA